jgi:hypothetical protein
MMDAGTAVVELTDPPHDASRHALEIRAQYLHCRPVLEAVSFISRLRFDFLFAN